eukprot:Rmarinus@m.19453
MVKTGHLGLKSCLKTETSKNTRTAIKRVRFREDPVYGPLKRQKEQNYIFMQNSSTVARWTYARMVINIIETWMIPYRLCMGHRGIYAMDIVIDVFLFFDIGMTLRTSYVDDNGVEIVNPKKIFHRYWKNNMWLDIITLFSIYFALPSTGTCAEEPVWILASIFRMRRPYSLFSRFRRLEMDPHINVRKMALLKFFVLLVGAAHWIGCLWYYLAFLGDFDENTWVSQYEGLNRHYHHEDAESAVNYLLALFWGFNSLTNMGNLGILPSSPQEIIYGLLVIFAQALFYAYVLGSIFHYLIRKDEQREAIAHHSRMLEDYAKSRHLPAQLVKRLRNYFDFYYGKRDGNENIIALMPPTLQLTVANFQFAHIVNKVAVLRGCSGIFLKSLMVKLRKTYLMPREVLVRQGEMSRELYFVLHGFVEVVDPAGEVITVVHSDSEGEGPVLGDLAFFIGIAHPYTLRASAKGDVTLLTFEKLSYEEILEAYPEQHDVITSNVLHRFGLDSHGNIVRQALQSQEGEDDPRFEEVKQTMQQALKRKNEMALTAMTYAASDGDAETVRNLLLRGVDANIGDYDSRTTLHLAASEGSHSVVSILIKHGANLNVRDRWGHTPLQDAVSNGHDVVSQMLSQAGGRLEFEDPGGVLCEASSEGDIERLRRLIAHGVSPETGDYDVRTSYHLAAAEGHLSLVDYLTSLPFNVNVTDRWGHTALDDAVNSAQGTIAEVLFSRGARMSHEFAMRKLRYAAQNGDFQSVTLILNHGVDVNEMQYDRRTALHWAAESGHVVIVSALLALQADVFIQDRWGQSAFDCAMRWGHLGCALLIHYAGHPVEPEQAELLAAGVTMAEIQAQVRDQHWRTRPVPITSMVRGIAQVVSQEVDTTKSGLSLVQIHGPLIVEILKERDAQSQSSPWTAEQCARIWYALHKIMMKSNVLSELLVRFRDGISPLAQNPHVKPDEFTSCLEKLGVHFHGALPNDVTQLVHEWNTLLGYRTVTPTPGLDFDYDGLLTSDLFLKLIGYHTVDLNRQLAELEALASPAVDDDDDDAMPDSAAAASGRKEDGKLTLPSTHKLGEEIPRPFGERLRTAIGTILFFFNSLADPKTKTIDSKHLHILSNEVNKAMRKEGDCVLTSTLVQIVSKQEVAEVSMKDFVRNMLECLDVSSSTITTEEDADDVGEITPARALKRNAVHPVSLKQMVSSDEITVTYMDGENGTPTEPAPGFVKLLFRIATCFYFCQVFLGFIRRFGYLGGATITLSDKLDLRAAFQSCTPPGGDKYELRGFSVMRLWSVFAAHSNVNVFAMTRLYLDTLRIQGRTVVMRYQHLQEGISKWKNPADKYGENTVERHGYVYVFMPDTTFLRNWDYFVQLMCAFYVFSVPFRIAYLTHVPTVADGRWELSSFIPDFAVDSFFILNCALQFLRAFVDENSVTVTDLRTIRDHYLAKSFLWDLIAMVPLDLFAYSAGAGFTYMAWLRMAKLFHARRLRFVFRLTQHGMLATILVMLVMLITLLHWCACVWFFVATRQGYNELTWYSEHQGYGSLDDGYGPVDEYLVSFYWVTASVASVGQPEIMPVSNVEFGVSILLMGCSLTVYAFILGEISSLVMKQDERLVALRADLLSLEEYLTSNSFPWDLENNVRQQVGTRMAELRSRGNETADGAAEEQIYGALSHALKVEISKHVTLEVLQKSSIFDGCSDVFRDAVGVLLHERTIPPQAEIFRQGEMAKELYLIHSGVVEITDTNENREVVVQQTLHVGSEVGDVSFFFNIKHMNGARVGLQPVTLLVLTKDDYLSLSKVYPDQEDAVIRNALERWDAHIRQVMLRRRSSVGGSSTGLGSDSARSWGMSSVSSSNTGSDWWSGSNEEDVIEAIKQARKNKEMDRIVFLCKAAASGDLDALQKSSLPSDINPGDYDQRTPLHLAASEGHQDCARWLIQQGANVDCQDRFGNTPIIDAVTYGHETTARILAEGGARLPPEHAANTLISASASGDLKKVQTLIEFGTNPNCVDYDKRSPLHLAASEGHLHVVEFLLSSHVNPNPVDRWGGTPMDDAVRHNHREVWRTIRKAGGRVWADDIGHQLNSAAAEGNLARLQIYLDAGVSVNTATEELRTPLHLAASNGRVVVVDFLLEQPDIDVNMIDFLGRTPLDDAIREQHHVVALMLQQKGGAVGADPRLAQRVQEAQHVYHRDLAVRAKNSLQLLERDRTQVIFCDEIISAKRSLAECVNQTRAWLESLFHSNIHRDKERFRKKKSRIQGALKIFRQGLPVLRKTEEGTLKILQELKSRSAQLGTNLDSSFEALSSYQLLLHELLQQLELILLSSKVDEGKAEDTVPLSHVIRSYKSVRLNTNNPRGSVLFDASQLSTLASSLDHKGNVDHSDSPIPSPLIDTDDAANDLSPSNHRSPLVDASSSSPAKISSPLVPKNTRTSDLAMRSPNLSDHSRLSDLGREGRRSDTRVSDLWSEGRRSDIRVNLSQMSSPHAHSSPQNPQWSGSSQLI